MPAAVTAAAHKLAINGGQNACSIYGPWADDLEVLSIKVRYSLIKVRYSLIGINVQEVLDPSRSRFDGPISQGDSTRWQKV